VLTSKFELRLLQLVVVATSALVTLMFTSKAIDPFTLPKLLLLIVGATAALPFVFRNLGTLFRTISTGSKLFLFGLLLFLLITLTSALTSQNPVNGIWGEYGRSNGFLNYLGLAILGVATFFAFESPRTLIISLSFVAFVTNVYGVMQHNNADFIRWNNPFNPVITTFGNPNFAAAFAGISAGGYIYLLLFEKERILKYFSFFGMLAAIGVVVYSEVTQALFTFATSISLPILLWIFRRSKAIFLITSSLGTVLGVISILGVFRIGPLSELLGKSTFIYRTDYWLAGWKMMLNHPWLGVGADQYGNYFQEYRTLEQINRVNAAVMANNAHNVFIQIGATVGVIGLIVFLIFTISPIISGIRALKTLSKTHQESLVAALGIFLAYFIQATVSIDHIGLSIWGWLFGAICLRTSVKFNTNQVNKKDKYRGYSKVTLALGLIGTLIISPILIQKISFDIRMNNVVGKLWPSDAGNGPTDPSERQVAIESILSTYGTKNYDPQYTLFIAKTFRNWNEKDLALTFAQEVLTREPRSFDAWNLIASIYENNNEIQKALSYRLKSISLDPNNFELKLLVAQDYLSVGDSNKSRDYLAQVLRDAPKSTNVYQSALAVAEKLNVKN